MCGRGAGEVRERCGRDAAQVRGNMNGKSSKSGKCGKCGKCGKYGKCGKCGDCGKEIIRKGLFDFSRKFARI